MAEENIRSRGVVVRFNEQKGYIFIKPDGGGDNLFVHHTKIKSDGYRTLCEGQTVEFLVKLNNNKTILTLPLLTRFATVAAAAAPVVGLVMALAVAKEGGIVGLEEVVVDATTVIIHEKSDHLVVETSQEVTVVPYGDYFCVEGLWDVERDGDESEHCCILRVYVNVAFSKKTMWRDPDEPKRKEKRQKGGNSGILTPIPLSDALVKFIGTGETALSRAKVMKRIWDYIKQNNL